MFCNSKETRRIYEKIFLFFFGLLYIFVTLKIFLILKYFTNKTSTVEKTLTYLRTIYRGENLFLKSISLLEDDF